MHACACMFDKQVTRTGTGIDKQAISSLINHNDNLCLLIVRYLNPATASRCGCRRAPAPRLCAPNLIHTWMKGPYTTLACYMPDLGRPGSLVAVAKTVTFQKCQLQPCAGAKQARCAGVTCAPIAPRTGGGPWNPASLDYPPCTKHHRARTMFPLKIASLETCCDLF